MILAHSEEELLNIIYKTIQYNIYMGIIFRDG